MISTLIDRLLDQRLLVVAGAVALLLGGLYAFQHLNIEAYPDPSPPTIEVIAQNPGWSDTARNASATDGSNAFPHRWRASRTAASRPPILWKASMKLVT